MTQRLFVLDVPENAFVVGVARRDPDIDLTRIGPYFVLSAQESICVDRRSTGSRHAVWYSWISGLDGWRIVQWDGDALRLERR